MKNYYYKDYSGMGELKRDMLVGLNEELQDVELSSTRFSDCEILEVLGWTNVNGKEDIQVEVSLKGGIKTFCLLSAIAAGTFTLPKAKQETLNSFMSQLGQAQEDLNVELAEQAKISEAKREEENRVREIKLAAREKARKAREEAEKAEKKKERYRQKFSDMCFEAKSKGLDINDEETVVGWLAKHTTRIAATIPDWMDAQFTSRFPDAPKTIIDTSTKSSGGFDKQWSLGTEIHVDDIDSMPPVLQTLKWNKKTKLLRSNKFVLGLIYNYNFKFGKEQDVEAIKETIANQEAFSLGFNA